MQKSPCTNSFSALQGLKDDGKRLASMFQFLTAVFKKTLKVTDL